MTPESRPLEAHSVRPTDLVALVTFDDEVYENQAVTRERLARPGDAPRPLAAAIEEWLGFGRHTWLDMRGRQLEGIATARDLADGVWAIDTLIDASDGATPVLAALLRKAADAARAERVTHVLLRTRLDAPAHAAALHAGFQRVLVEQVWHGALAASPHASGDVRPATEADDFACFQLFNRALPLAGRQALCATLDEWRRTRERRWLGRGSSEWVASVEDRLAGALRLNPTGPLAQLDLLLEPEGAAAGAALLAAAGAALGEHESRTVLALTPAAVLDSGRLLEEHGLALAAEYTLLCHRTTKPVGQRRRVPAGAAVPTSG